MSFEKQIRCSQQLFKAFDDGLPELATGDFTVRACLGDDGAMLVYLIGDDEAAIARLAAQL